MLPGGEFGKQVDGRAGTLSGEVLAFTGIRLKIKEEGFATLDPNQLQVEIPNRGDGASPPEQLLVRSVRSPRVQPGIEIDTVETV